MEVTSSQAHVNYVAFEKAPQLITQAYLSVGQVINIRQAMLVMFYSGYSPLVPPQLRGGP